MNRPAECTLQHGNELLSDRMLQKHTATAAGRGALMHSGNRCNAVYRYQHLSSVSLGVEVHTARWCVLGAFIPALKSLAAISTLPKPGRASIRTPSGAMAFNLQQCGDLLGSRGC